MLKNYNELLLNRSEIRKTADRDKGFRDEVVARCEEDSIYWCNNFATTYDPRTKNRDLPFILFPKQIELVRWIEDLLEDEDDGAIEKSRDMGVSYTTLVPVVLYRWLFHEFNAKIGSRKEELVDRSDDPDALFWKIDYNLRKLPKWMLPEGFDWKQHRTYMRLSRPDNSNTITGESANEDFGRAGRYNLTLLDELGFWNWAKSSWEACGESATTRLAISTPPKTGRASQFYKIVKSGKTKVFTFHYKEDPRKDIEWESKQRAKKTTEEFERELNISYSGSLQGTVYGVQFNLCQFKDLTYDPLLPLFTSWDFGLDATSIIWLQWQQKVDKWRLIDSYEGHNIDVGFYIPFVTGVVKSGSTYDYTEADLKKITEHKGWKGATHFGDPDVNKRSYQTKGTISTRQVLQKGGVYVQAKPWAGRTHYDLRQKTLLFLKKLTIDENKNELFCDAIRNSRYPERQETSQTTTPITKPIHDWTSHFRTALEYMADNAPEVRRQEKPTRKRKSIWER